MKLTPTLRTIVNIELPHLILKTEVAKVWSWAREITKGRYSRRRIASTKNFYTKIFILSNNPDIFNFFIEKSFKSFCPHRQRNKKPVQSIFCKSGKFNSSSLCDFRQTITKKKRACICELFYRQRTAFTRRTINSCLINNRVSEMARVVVSCREEPCNNESNNQPPDIGHRHPCGHGHHSNYCEFTTMDNPSGQIDRCN